MYGEGIVVTWNEPSPGQPKKMQLVEKGRRFANGSKFAFEVYKAVMKLGLL
jgi:hypothetical protein